MTAAFLVAGTASGVGKTTITLGLMGALARRGLAVAPFKAGPDFIDPGLHRLAAGKPSRNLDTWMMGEARVRGAFARHVAGADVAVVEGVMGLFDGAPGSAEGSSAHLAKTVGIPVVLVVDASGMAASVAAVVHGFATLDPALAVAGVILNRVAGASHLAHLTAAITDQTGVPVLGHLLRDERASLPSRHLGLVTADDLPRADRDYGAALAHMADQVAAHVDLDLLIARAALVRPAAPPRPAVLPRVRLAVARDAAFCFCYPDNLECLAAAGAEIVPFSPLADSRLPEGVDGLYLPGGYPELHGAALAANTPMIESVKAACRAGMPVFAECGGLMYLSDGVTVADGTRHRFCGVLPAATAMQEKRAALGYREITVTEPGLLGEAGTGLRGHEFHYSSVDQDALDAAGIARTLSLARRGGEGRAEGYRVGNTLATYAHVLLDERAAACWVAALEKGAGAAAGPGGAAQGA